MALAQLVAHYNHWFRRTAQPSARTPFALEEDAVVASFYGLRLESAFEALRDPKGRVLGHRAELRSFSPLGRRVASRAPYAVALDEDSIVHLDRLIRTLHVLNAIAQGLTGLLVLEVHPWHIARVADDHGAVFEAILRDCGLTPRDVVLEITEAGAQDDRHLARAIACFQARGFGIALQQRSVDQQELARLLALQPDIIQLGSAHLQAAEASADAGRELANRIQTIQQRQLRVFLHGVTTDHQVQIACWVGADGYQDGVRHPVEDTTVIIVPGLGDSGPEHWQTLWGRDHPAFRRVRQRDWQRPDVDEWVEALDREIHQAPSPVVLVGHSLGCINIVEWASRRWADIRGALLVAPADADRHRLFSRVSLRPLPFPSILVASQNDPYLEPERARLFARQWGSRLVDIGRAGHINVEAGFGPWPQGESLLAELRIGVGAPLVEPVLPTTLGAALSITANALG